MCASAGSLSSVTICLNRKSETTIVRKCFMGSPPDSTLRPSPTAVAPGLKMLVDRPETDHPLSRTRSSGELGKSECLGKVAPKGLSVLMTCPSRSFRMSHEPSGIGVAAN